MPSLLSWLSEKFTSALKIPKEEIKEGKQSEFWFEDINGMVNFVVKRPYHCPRCQFVWDNKKRFRLHISHCLLGRSSVSAYATGEIAFHFDDQRSLKSNIPADRCSVKLSTGLRKGKFCLRKKSQKTFRCQLHSIESSNVKLKNTSDLVQRIQGDTKTCVDKVGAVTEDPNFTQAHIACLEPSDMLKYEKEAPFFLSNACWFRKPSSAASLT